MALKWMEGFEHYGLGATGRANMLNGLYNSVAAGAYNSEIVNTQARTGSNALRVNSGSNGGEGGVRRPILYAGNEIGTAFGLYISSFIQSRQHITAFEFGASAVISIVVNETGGVEVRAGGSTGTIIGATAAGLLTAASWNHMEYRVVRDDVVGEVEIVINGIVQMILTNINTGTVEYTTIKSSSYATNTYIDDWVFKDGDGEPSWLTIGPARVLTGYLVADEPGGDWTVVGAASGAEAVDETIPDGDTTYIQAAIAGDVSEFTMPTLPPEAENILGVYIPTMAKLASPGVGHMRTSLVSDGNVSNGGDRPITSAYTYRGDVFEFDPATGDQWLKADLEAAILRVEKTL